jgi:hypothetical protein
MSSVVHFTDQTEYHLLNLILPLYEGKRKEIFFDPKVTEWKNRGRMEDEVFIEVLDRG